MKQKGFLATSAKKVLKALDVHTAPFAMALLNVCPLWAPCEFQTGMEMKSHYDPCDNEPATLDLSALEHYLK